jgi:peptidoglycan/xylan/chitin deacetylase (PgdA/CDA1 family)/2-polyprenyl-3-methyl-5-hydroxy-6-metoxy-1,4-benzoquinol methylase
MPGLVLGRDARAPLGTSASRRAALPAANAAELLELAESSGQPTVLVGRLGEGARAAYAPDVMRREPTSPRTVAGKSERTSESVYGRHHFETLFASHADPWRYTTPYEQTKYEQTLALIPDLPRAHALELACAEGHFTVQLAPRVASLVAADISVVALERAAGRCAAFDNVRFTQLDFFRDPIPGHFGLIVCSEVLYFVGGRSELHEVARKLAAALEPGGYLALAHANVVVDDPGQTGFDWRVPFGAKVIGEVFGALPELTWVRELRTPLYRIQLFQRLTTLRARLDRLTHGHDAPPHPHDVRVARHADPEPDVAAHVLWNGGTVQGGEAPHAASWRLPILTYHRIAERGPAALARYRVSPHAFEEQLRYLRDARFHSVTLDEWRVAKERREPLPGRAVMLTFDDAYLDLAQHGWPLLERYGFSAVVLAVTDHVGGRSVWDAAYGEPAPLLGWDDIRRLRDRGAQFGSHSATHPHLTALSPEEVVREAARSRATLERELGTRVTTLAYPHGAEDAAVQQLVGACGYTFGLSCRPGPSELWDPLLALQRIEVTGDDTLPEFIAKLGS